jgi:hypothetical protein
MIETKVVLDSAQDHFFRAMLSGWMAGNKAVNVPGMPRHKEFMYKSGDFRVLDRYCSSPAGKSAGTTTIWFGDNPVWFMSYGGEYRRKRDIAFLRSVITPIYEARIFVGGRGPSHLVNRTSFSSLVYTNQVEKGSDFSSFRGREEISEHDSGMPPGFHDYWGMALI